MTDAEKLLVLNDWFTWSGGEGVGGRWVIGRSLRAGHYSLCSAWASTCMSKSM
jgi:hypothetical protein